MCGRYTLSGPDSVGERFGVEFVDFHETKIPPRFNVAPSQLVLTVVESPDGRAARLMRWGFQPSWQTAPKGPPPINARAEGLLERTLFRGSLARGRCLIPADGFYEWAAQPGAKGKQPIHLRLKDGRLFAFAGLWAPAPDGQETCAIVTTAASGTIAAFHQRMPVILRPEAEAAWLDPTLTDPRAALAALDCLPGDALEAYPVSGLVSSARNDGPELIRPLPSGSAPTAAESERDGGAGQLSFDRLLGG